MLLSKCTVCDSTKSKYVKEHQRVPILNDSTISNILF